MYHKLKMYNQHVTTCRMSVTEFNTHTTYYNGFFLLRTPLIINGQPAVIGCSNNGELTLDCCNPQVSITFDSLFTEVDTVVKRHGLSGVSNGWCDEVPLFQLKFSHCDNITQFLQSAEKIQRELAVKVSAILIKEQQESDPTAPPSILPVTIHTEVYLLTPDPVNKYAGVVEVTLVKLSDCLTRWKESEVFRFGALFQTYRENPKVKALRGIIM